MKGVREFSLFCLSSSKVPRSTSSVFRFCFSVCFFGYPLLVNFDSRESIALDASSDDEQIFLIRRNFPYGILAICFGGL